MLILCQDQEQTINLNNFNSLYFENERIREEIEYRVKVDIGKKTYILGVYYSFEKVNKTYNEILDNLIIGDRTLLYKMPKDERKLSNTGKSTLVDFGKITLDDVLKNKS